MSEAGQVERLVNPLRHGGQHDLAAIVTFAVLLTDKQGAKTGAGHVLQSIQIQHDLVDTSLVGCFKALGQLGSSVY